MKNILTLLLLLMSLCVSAQNDETEKLNNEAEKLYAEGTKLFTAKKYAEAIPYFQKCDSLVRMMQTDSSKNHCMEMVATCWLYIARNYYNTGNYPEAVKSATIAVDIQKKFYGEENENYVRILSQLGSFSNRNGNSAEGIRFIKHALELGKKVFGEQHLEYVNILNALATCYSSIGNYAEAIEIETMVVKFYSNHPERPLDYPTTMLNLGLLYRFAGKYHESIEHIITAANIFKKVSGDNSSIYVSAVNALFIGYSLIGNYTEAIKQGNIVVEYYKNNGGGAQYAIALKNLAVQHGYIGNYPEAIRLETMSMEIEKNLWGENSSAYIGSLNNLATYYATSGNYTEAINLATMILEKWKISLGEEHPNYLTTLGNLATMYSFIGNYEEAIRIGTIVMNKRKKVLGENHPDYARALDDLASCYSFVGDYSEAIRLELLAVEIRKKILGVNHPDYALSLNNLAFLNFNAKQYGDAVKYYKEGHKLSNSYVLKNFSSMTSKERTHFWSWISEYTNKALPIFAYTLTTIPAYQGKKISKEFNGLAYNWLVFTKGLLLNTELEIQKVIEQSNDTSLTQRFAKLKADRARLDKLYAMSLESRTEDADSLLKVVEDEERQIVENSKELGDYTKHLSVEWGDIQKKLDRHSVSIEFASCKDSTMRDIYIAFVLKKGMKAPKVVKLFASDNFLEIEASEYYNTPKLYNLIWKPLEQYIDGAKNVYFSPTGLLHNIAIEYLPNENNEIFAKQYNAYRLSSTRELALPHETNPNKKASVFGGIVYNFDETDWQNVDENAERGGEILKFLNAAKVESEEITSILKDNSFDVEFGTGKAATEGSFKNLSGSGIKILHVATHGFYEPESKQNSFANMLSSGDEHSQEDRSLSRSGLFFAGANTFLNPEQRQFIPEGVDDGILTSKEISRLDFKGLDLVVLSACETGLGEVTGEGVFGLQRGFKKAGAQTIIMTLWNVNDKPAKEFMTEFYRNLMAGKSKREAFISAQDKNRVKYINPKMWAGFIMVDGEE